MAARTGAYAVLFNAPGAADMKHGASNNMTTYIRQHDVVGTLGTHIGALKQYPDVKVDLHTAEPYLYRNHTIVPLRKDISAGMAPLVNPVGMFTELARGVEKAEADAKDVEAGMGKLAGKVASEKAAAIKNSCAGDAVKKGCKGDSGAELLRCLAKDAKALSESCKDEFRASPKKKHKFSL